MYVQLNSLSERTLEIVNSPEIRTDISAAEINQILNRLRRAGKEREAQDFWSKYYNLVDDGYKYIQSVPPNISTISSLY